MQESWSFDSHAESPAEGGEAGRHRAHGKPAARRAYVASAAVALVGLGLTGVSAAVTDDGDHGRLADSVAAADEQSRSDVADRADRSTRDEPAPASASPSAASSAPAPADQNSATPVPAAENSASAAAEPAPKPDWVSPMPGAKITSCYGQRWGTLHAGVDLARPENTPIHAAGAGTVVAAGWVYTGYGISVVIDHRNGYLTHYAHQNKTNVRVGQRVAAGDLIGWEGSTGDSTGPHLHFEVHKGMWNQVNPAPWMKARGVDLGC